MLPELNRHVPPLAEPPAPFLASCFTPAGPPATSLVEAGDARVLSVPGRYCVTHIIEGPEGLVMVDVGSVSDVERLEPAVEWLGKPVRLVIPSHLHFDHIMGIDAAASRFGARIGLGHVAHNHVTRRLHTRSIRRPDAKTGFLVWLWQGLPVFSGRDLRHGAGFGFPWSRNQFCAPLGKVLAEGEELEDLPGWRVLETPGHADDAICLFHEKGGFLVAGDTVRNFLGGEWNIIETDPEAYANTRERLESLEIQAIFPGHGPLVFGENVVRILKSPS